MNEEILIDLGEVSEKTMGNGVCAAEGFGLTFKQEIPQGETECP